MTHGVAFQLGISKESILAKIVKLLSLEILSQFPCLFILFDSLRPSQHFFQSCQMDLPGLNQYKTEDKSIAQVHNAWPIFLVWVITHAMFW